MNVVLSSAGTIFDVVDALATTVNDFGRCLLVAVALLYLPLIASVAQSTFSLASSSDVHSFMINKLESTRRKTWE